MKEHSNWIRENEPFQFHMKISTTKLGIHKTSIISAIVCLLGLGIQSGFAEVISIDPVLAGKNFSSTQTKTFLWEAKKAKVTLVFIPGGDGKLGLTDDMKDLGGFYGNTLKPLTDPRILTAGQVDVVVFDNPSALDGGGKLYPTSRATEDHMMRIESVVLYYKEKLNKPIWLMGHSNGAVSVTEFYKYLQNSHNEKLIAGMIFSSGRDGADFSSSTTSLPVLFLADNQDGCPKNTKAAAFAVYERLKQVDAAKVQYVLIEGHASPQGDPCHSGSHMFYGASDQAYKAIDTFINSLY